VNGPAWLAGQLAITAAQLVTHFSNDYFDLDADRSHPDRPRWSGGSGVLVEGTVPAGWAIAAAGLSAAVALAASAVAVAAAGAGLGAGVLLLLVLGAAWSYSAPPLRLHSTGFGELAGASLIAAGTPLVGYVLQGGTQPLAASAFCMPFVGLQFAMLVAVSLPDVAGDRRAGKRTLAVRRSPRWAARVASLAIGAAFAAAPLALSAAGAARMGTALAPWVPLGAWVAWRLWRWRPAPTAADADRLSFWAIGLVMGPAGTMVAALVVGRGGA
jgi:1,4-dihydroxy-2-naphthoate octaprenyltransferase